MNTRQIRLTRYLFYWGIWTLLGLYRAVQWLRYSEGPAWQIISLAMSNLYFWGLLYPLMARLILKLVRRGKRWYLNILPQIIIGCTFTLIHLMFYYAINLWLAGFTGINPYTADLNNDNLTTFISSLFLWELFFAIQIMAVIYLVEYRRLSEERKRQAVQLEQQLAKAKLTSLKMQLHPHFLFNTLNSIYTLIDTDVTLARRMLARLSEFLRITISGFNKLEVSLKEELEFIKNYLAIEKVRFMDRLRVTYDIESLTYDARVPSLILQPVVENAVRHGIAPYSQGGEIVIHSRRESRNLTILVSDNGPGRKKEKENCGGIGLINVKERLEQKYGNHYRLEHGNRPDQGGYYVKITIPFTGP